MIIVCIILFDNQSVKGYRRVISEKAPPPLYIIWTLHAPIRTVLIGSIFQKIAAINGVFIIKIKTKFPDKCVHKDKGIFHAAESNTCAENNSQGMYKMYRTTQNVTQDLHCKELNHFPYQSTPLERWMIYVEHNKQLRWQTLLYVIEKCRR